MRVKEHSAMLHSETHHANMHLIKSQPLLFDNCISYTAILSFFCSIATLTRTAFLMQVHLTHCRYLDQKLSGTFSQDFTCNSNGISPIHFYSNCPGFICISIHLLQLNAVQPLPALMIGIFLMIMTFLIALPYPISAAYRGRSVISHLFWNNSSQRVWPLGLKTIVSTVRSKSCRPNLLRKSKANSGKN